MISRIGQARRSTRAIRRRQVRHDHEPFLIRHMVSARLANMLLSGGWGPHGDSGVGLSNPLESHSTPATQPLSKRPLSGLSGAATAPIYIRQIGLVAVWSIIKFLAGLGGILLAQPAAKLWWEQSVPIMIAIFQHRYFDLDRSLELNLAPGLR